MHLSNSPPLPVVVYPMVEWSDFLYRNKKTAVSQHKRLATSSMTSTSALDNLDGTRSDDATFSSFKIKYGNTMILQSPDRFYQTYCQSSPRGGSTDVRNLGKPSFCGLVVTRGFLEMLEFSPEMRRPPGKLQRLYRAAIRRPVLATGADNTKPPLSGSADHLSCGG